MPRHSHQLIYCDNYLGPCFGDDLVITDKCDKNRKSKIRHFENYKLEGESD